MARVIKHQNNDEIQLLFKKVNSFFNKDCSAYMAIGGIGDLLLVLASCYDQKNPKVLFLSNDPNNKFASDFFKFFNVKFLMHRNIAGLSSFKLLYRYFINMPIFKTSAHLPDDLNYGDWIDVEKYKPRIRTNTNWDSYIEKKRWFKEKYVIICPCGSTKELHKKRYLSNEEYKLIMLEFLKRNYKIITTSHEADISLYGLFPNKNCVWMTNDKIINYDGTFTNIDLKEFLQISYNSDCCISVDTYFKTLILLLNKEVLVIKSKYDGKYNENDFIDPSDKIFLNENIWTKLKTYKFEDLLFVLKNYLTTA